MRWSLFLIACLAFAGCKTTAEAPNEETMPEETAQTQMIDGIEGTVVYQELEGGFYGIRTDAGENLFPINLDDSFREDGLRIVFTMKERSDIMTTVMWGKTVEITEIRRN